MVIVITGEKLEKLVIGGSLHFNTFLPFDLALPAPQRHQPPERVASKPTTCAAWCSSSFPGCLRASPHLLGPVRMRTK